MITEKLAAVQKTLKAPKNQRNTFGNYNYRSCEDILEAVKPILAKADLTLTISDDIVLIGDRIYVKATATLYDSKSEADGKIDSISVSAFAREEESKKGMDASQVTGAASSYARKYALNGLFCIDDTKDADATNTHGKEVEKPIEKSVEKPMFVCEKCGKQLTPYKDSKGKTVSLRAHAEASEKKFGAVLCLDCIKEVKDA